MWQKTSKPSTLLLQKKELRRWLNEFFILFFIHKLWRSALTPEKDRSQSKFSSLHEVTCTWEGACISIHFCTFSLVFVGFHWFRSLLHNLECLHGKPHACKSPHVEMNYGNHFGPSLAPARCPKVYEYKIKKYFVESSPWVLFMQRGRMRFGRLL